MIASSSRFSVIFMMAVVLILGGSLSLASTFLKADIPTLVTMSESVVHAPSLACRVHGTKTRR